MMMQRSNKVSSFPLILSSSINFWSGDRHNSVTNGDKMTHRRECSAGRVGLPVLTRRRRTRSPPLSHLHLCWSFSGRATLTCAKNAVVKQPAGNFYSEASGAGGGCRGLRCRSANLI